MPGPPTIQPSQQPPNDVASSAKRSIAPLPSGAPGSNTTPQQQLKNPPSAKSSDRTPPVGQVSGAKEAPKQTGAQHERGKHSADKSSHRASTMPKGAPQLTKVPEGSASRSGKAAPLPSGITAVKAGDHHPTETSPQLPKGQVTSQATGAVSGDANLGRLPGAPQQGGQQLRSITDPYAPPSPSSVPPTNLTFYHIKDPAQRQKAYENQENMAFTLKAVPEVLTMQRAVDMLKGGLFRNDEGKWALGHEKATSGDRAVDFLKDQAVDKGIERVAGLASKQLAEKVGAVSAGLKALQDLQDYHDDNKAARVGPEGDKFREQKTVGLVAEHMAPAFAERTRRMVGGPFSEEDGREKLVEKYWEFKEQLETQLKNMPPSHPDSGPAWKQGY